MKLSDEEIYMAKEEACRLGECTATYYLVNLIGEVEFSRKEFDALKSSHKELVKAIKFTLENYVALDDTEAYDRLSLALENAKKLVK